MIRQALRGESTWQAVAVVLAIVVAAVLPLVLPVFWVSLLTEILILGLFAMSFNLLFGYTGLLSFGHAAYYGTGAYAVAILLSGPAFVPELDSFLLALVLGVLIATIAAGLIGVVCVQRGALSFAILTLAFNMMLYQIVFQWVDVTGGDDGVIMSSTPVVLGSLSFNPLDTGAYYYFVLVVMLGSLWMLWRIIQSPYGELLMAIRENPDRAAFSAIPVKRYQWTAFLLSGVFAGLAGALATVQTYVISPDLVHWSKSAEPVLVTLLGGPATFLGPVVGAFMFVALEQALTNVTQHWQFGLGAILVVIVLYLPGGVLKALVDQINRLNLRSRFNRWRPSIENR